MLDVAMPAMNGFELFHAFRELPIPAFPIVFLSARVTRVTSKPDEPSTRSTSRSRT